MSRWRIAGLLGWILWLSGCSEPSAESWVAQAGVLDLRSFDFSGSEAVSLNGEWLFMPGDLETPWAKLSTGPVRHRTVPDLWKDNEAGGSDGHGAGTYHLTVLLPPETPPLAFRYISASTAFRLELQDRPLIQVGVPSLEAQNSQAAYRPGTVRVPSLPSRLEIDVRVSNHVYRVGGLWFPIKLGRADLIEKDALGDFTLALAHAVALAAMALILFVLASLRPQERSFLYSGLLALTLAVRVVVTGDVIVTRFWPSIPFELLIRAEYLSVFVCFPMATALFQALIPGFLSRPWAVLCSSASAVFVVLALSLPLDLLTRTINAYYVIAIFTIAIFLRSFGIHALRHRDGSAILLLIAALVLALGIINDVFYSSFLWKTGNLGTWGFLFFVVTLVWIVFKRLTSAFSEVERLVAQKDLLLLEIHHRVRNNLQMVAGLVSLQAKRIPQAEVRDALATLRSRVLSMGLVHDKLYGLTSNEHLDLGSYIRDLLKLLIPQDAVEDGTVQLEIRVDSMIKSVSTAIDVGLVVTELINNAWKHSLLPRGGGNVRVTIVSEGPSVVLLVEDDGPGFPPGFRPDPQSTLGFQLVTNLASRNRGTWEVLPGPGGRVRVQLN